MARKPPSSLNATSQLGLFHVCFLSKIRSHPDLFISTLRLLAPNQGSDNIKAKTFLFKEYFQARLDNSDLIRFMYALNWVQLLGSNLVMLIRHTRAMHVAPSTRFVLCSSFYHPLILNLSHSPENPTSFKPSNHYGTSRWRRQIIAFANIEEGSFVWTEQLGPLQGLG